MTVANLAQAAPTEAPRPANWRAMRPPVEALHPLPPVGELIAALNSPSYDERERATRLLPRHGAAAVPLLAEATRSDNHEVAIRAINALEQLWLRGLEQQDVPASEAALKAMDVMRTSADPTLLDRVDAIYAMHDRRLYEYSIHQVRRLGGSVLFNKDIQDFNADGSLRQEVDYIIVTRDWTGGLDGLRHVRRLTPRNGVYFIKGADLPENVAQIFEDVPASVRIKAQTRGASHLGVHTQANLGIQECLITGTEEGSAAAKAGMRAGDVIETFNNVEVATFNALVDEIATIEPGETVPATVNRGGETIELQVTLQEWK